MRALEQQKQSFSDDCFLTIKQIFIAFQIFSFSERPQDSCKILDFSKFKYTAIEDTSLGRGADLIDCQTFFIEELYTNLYQGLQLILLEDESLTLGQVNLQELEESSVVSVLVKTTKDTLLMMHPEIFMQLIIRIQTQQTSITQTNRFGTATVYK